MISEDSPLRRLPPQLDRKQALFLDGIRHAAELAELAYQRLRTTLTFIAQYEGEARRLRAHYSAAYLDAWAFVDTVDRFRSLWILQPHVSMGAPASGERTFQELSEPIRNLRNVSDHLAQRADYVVARQGTALGVLSWFTILSTDPLAGVICTIAPGTVLSGARPIVNPAGRAIEYPTGAIELTAGEHTASLSEIYPEMKRRISALETSLSEGLKRQQIFEAAGADLLVKLSISFGAEAACEAGIAQQSAQADDPASGAPTA